MWLTIYACYAMIQVSGLLKNNMKMSLNRGVIAI